MEDLLKSEIQIVSKGRLVKTITVDELFQSFEAKMKAAEPKASKKEARPKEAKATKK